MAKEEKCNCVTAKNQKAACNAGAGAVYGFGLIGALVFYLSNANSFTSGLLGVLKAFVWPAMLVYHLFGFLGM